MSRIISIDFPKSEWIHPIELPQYERSGWRGIEKILPALLKEFNVQCDYALEMGVEYGTSTKILSRLFGHVTGVDTFVGDGHSGHKQDHYAETRGLLSDCENITLVQEDYKRWISHDRHMYHLIHVDMLHDFETTFRAGWWAIHHAPVVLFHDTCFFPEVSPAVSKIADGSGAIFYNYEECNGLGILVL